MLLGAHEGIAGGVSTAFARAEEDGADCLQIFTRNARGWAAKPLEAEEIARFKAEAKRTGKPVAAHSSYLINAGAADPEIRQKSWAALEDELRRCEQLGVPALIFHPGSNPDEAEGLTLCAEGMQRAIEAVKGKVELLTETTAGQGASLGHTFEQLARIREAIPKAARKRAAICVDSCHLFAAGYDLTTDAGYRKTFDELETTVGLAQVHAFHLNDSKKALGSRVDRHDHIGEGLMGLSPFRRLVNDARFGQVPAFLETDLRFKENLAVLRGLLK